MNFKLRPAMGVFALAITLTVFGTPKCATAQSQQDDRDHAQNQDRDSGRNQDSDHDRANNQQNHNRRNDRDRGDNGYYGSNRSPRGEGNNPGFSQGYQDGARVGQSDMAQRKPYQAYPRGAYASSDHGYHSGYGNKSAYQQAYANGYEQGYRSAAGGRGRR